MPNRSRLGRRRGQKNADKESPTSGHSRTDIGAAPRAKSSISVSYYGTAFVNWRRSARGARVSGQETRRSHGLVRPTEDSPENSNSSVTTMPWGANERVVQCGALCLEWFREWLIAAH